MTDIFHELFTEAQHQVQANPSADQVIVVKTANSHIRHFANNILSSNEDEIRFLHLLEQQDDNQLTHIVCMWNNFCVDLPSMHFRKQLLTACPKNEDAVILVQTGSSLIPRTVKSTMP